MDSQTLARLRPVDQSAEAIRDALAALGEARAAAAHRATALAAERTHLLLTATTAAIAKIEAAIREIATDQEQFDAIEGALLPLLEAAEAGEADAAHAELVREAVAATEQFNLWLRNEYSALATAVAGGIELERRAWRLRDKVRNTGGEGLPDISRAFVGLDGRSLEFLTRLPGIEAGGSLPAWPR